MKLMLLAAAVLITTGISCSKKIHSHSREDTSSTFSTKKNGTNWKVHAVSATYNVQDSMMHIMALGDNNERFTISFFKNPACKGKSRQFYAGTITPACEYCAGIAQQYSLDPLQQHSFRITGFDNANRRILGKFSVHLKKDSLYQGSFTQDAALYEGVFSVRYDSLAF